MEKVMIEQRADTGENHTMLQYQGRSITGKRKANKKPRVEIRPMCQECVRSRVCWGENYRRWAQE